MKLTTLQEKWLQALENGSYDQASVRLGRYRHENGCLAGTDSEEEASNPPNCFCCMGVACEIARNEGLIESYNPTNSYPDTDVIRLFGFLASNYICGMSGDKGTVALALLNDKEHLTFPEIAAKVRQSPETYFVSEI